MTREDQAVAAILTAQQRYEINLRDFHTCQNCGGFASHLVTVERNRFFEKVRATK